MRSHQCRVVPLQACCFYSTAGHAITVKMKLPKLLQLERQNMCYIACMCTVNQFYLGIFRKRLHTIMHSRVTRMLGRNLQS